jgi:hypothetical protein
MTDHVINWDDWNESVRRDLYWCAEELLSQVPDAIIRLAVSSSCASRDAGRRGCISPRARVGYFYWCAEELLER